jgi:hypothetical protein
MLEDQDFRKRVACQNSHVFWQFRSLENNTTGFILLWGESLGGVSRAIRAAVRIESD